MAAPKQNVRKRFLRKVAKQANSCWLWTGAKSLMTGYGMFWIQEKGCNDSAHRVAYRLFKGRIPKGKIVMHTCDVTSCVNPKHLRIGTYQDNADDKIAKGRQAYGELTRSKLSTAQVLEIRASRESHRSLAQRYGVKISTIQNVRARRTWAHLPPRLSDTKPNEIEDDRQRGSQQPGAKLTEEQVREIRASSEKCRTLALKYGVSYPLIAMIKRGETWKHVH